MSTSVRPQCELAEEHKAKLQALRDMVEASIAKGGSYTDQEVGAFLHAEAEKLRHQGS
jgi:antitoxin ParD1/3/4